MKKLLLTFVLIGLAGFANAGTFPETITSSVIENGTITNLFREYGQYLQQADGNYPSKMGKVLITKVDDHYEVAFYQVTDDGYKLIDEPVEFEGTHPPHAGAHSDPDVPCIEANKTDGSGKKYAFVHNGKVESK